MMHPAESRVLDMNSEALGVTTVTLMENAGRALARKVLEMGGTGKILAVCGPGNNGGDGIVAARLLSEAGRQVAVALVTSRQTIKTVPARDALSRLPEAVKVSEEAKPDMASGFDIIIDAMLGTGLGSEPREPFASWINAVNASGSRVVSVDVPSGLGTGLAVRPELTVTFHDAKLGMDSHNSGEVFIADIGIPKEAAEFVGPGDMAHYPLPAKDSHKGQNGRLLIIGGGPYAGAPALAAFAAHAIGADLVIIASPESSSTVIASYSPNFIVRSLEGSFLSCGHLSILESLAGDADAVLIGPGLGRDAETLKAAAELMGSSGKPMVVDADALHAASKGKVAFRVPAVLTPHAKEFTALGGSKQLTPDAVDVLACKYGATVLLKRPVDIISDGQNRKMNRTGNPGMTVGGTGDVLAGLVAGLMAKGVGPYEAARMGAYICGMAGDLAFDSLGFSMTATDVIACVPTVLKRCLCRL